MPFLRSSFLALALLSVACGGDSTGSSNLTAADISGEWDLNGTGCLAGDLPVRLSASSDGSLTSAVNAWTNDPAAAFSRPLEGSVDLNTGTAEFHMFGGGSKSSAVLFVGTLTAAGTVTGTFTDPMPGFAPIFHLSGDPICTAQVTGSRR